MNRRRFFSSEEEHMDLSAINLSYQQNFDLTNIPSGSEGFYNSAAFASTLSTTLSGLIQQSDQAHERGVEDIKKAINGET